MINGHGNDLYRYPGKILCDFSSNIPYRNESERIATHLAEHIRLIANYPDPDMCRFKKQIAKRYYLVPDMVLATNGSTEGFYLLAQLFAGKHSTVIYPAFAEYEDACALNRHKLSFFPIDQLQAGLTFQSDLVWLAVPNNPDGKLISQRVIIDLCDRNPETLFVLDCAYEVLCRNNMSLVQLHEFYTNLATIHSLTKTYAIPGLRLGYLIAQKTLIEKLKNLLPPWSVNALAQEAACFIMDNTRELYPDVNSLLDECNLFQDQVAGIPQLDVTSSPCNYFLVRMKKGNAADLKHYLIDRHGLLIRDASNFRGLSPQHFRLSVQQPRMNERLLEALREYFREIG